MRTKSLTFFPSVFEPLPSSALARASTLGDAIPWPFPRSDDVAGAASTTASTAPVRSTSRSRVSSPRMSHTRADARILYVRASVTPTPQRDLNETRGVHARQRCAKEVFIHELVYRRRAASMMRTTHRQGKEGKF